MIPLRYNVRNLRVRWTTTLMTVLITGVVVLMSVLAFGLIDALDHALLIGGNPLDLIVLRKGADNESSSGIDQSVAREIANLPGISRTAQGEPLCSAEYVTIVLKERRNHNGKTNLIVRGLTDVGRELRPAFKIVEGRDLRPGVNEAITSVQMAKRFETVGIGEQFEINQVNFTIVGYFEASGSAAESEVWTDIKDLTSARRIPSSVSSVNLRVPDIPVRDQIIKQLETDDRFNLKAVDEETYFKDQMQASIFLKIVGYVVAACLTFGAMFAAANTMYAAVSSRAREIGTLRALGFPGYSILFSFICESVLLCILGGVLGCLATIPFNGFSGGTMNGATFSELTFSFHFGPLVLLKGVLLALVMGMLGGLLPALQAIRLNIVDSLRKV